VGGAYSIRGGKALEEGPTGEDYPPSPGLTPGRLFLRWVNMMSGMQITKNCCATIRTFRIVISITRRSYFTIEYGDDTFAARETIRIVPDGIVTERTKE
jgi:hypothetical protein